MKRKTLRGYYKYVKSLPCLACGRLPRPGNPNHADHIRPYSYKFNHFTVRSHNGLPAFYCVPICPECHRTRHTMREQDFYEQAGYPLAVLYAYLAMQILQYFNEYQDVMEKEEEDDG